MAVLEKIGRLLARLRRYFSGGQRRPAPPPPDPYDPFARKPVPRRRGPHDRGTAVAVAEPDDE